MDISAQRPFGSRGVTVTTASLGGGGLGNFFRKLSTRDAHELVETAWEAGIRHFDTAPVYGRGRSERRLGVFLEDKPRDSYAVTTKVGRLMSPARGDLMDDGVFQNPAPFNPVYDYSYDGIMRSFEDSLQRLGMDRVDILHVHDIGEWIHGDEADTHLQVLKDSGVKALETLRDSGAIRAYGLGVNETQACLECLDYADPDGFLLAGRFTLLEQAGAKPLLDRCLERGVAVVVGSAFNSGILATGAVSGARYNFAEAPEAVLATVRRIETVCQRHNTPLSTVALHFPFMHPAVVSVLLGGGTRHNLERCIQGLSGDVPAALWQELYEADLLDPAFAP